MSIITFWNDTREQVGQTYTTVAVATKMAIERNYKVLLISTSINDSTIRKSFWSGENTTKLFNKGSEPVVGENGIEGLFKLLNSNKLTPSIITDYTKVVFKGRLEVISGYTSSRKVTREENLEMLKRIEENYIELIKTANQYYDMVIVDLDKRLSEKVRDEIIKLSDVNLLVLAQKMENLMEYKMLKGNGEDWAKNRCIPVVAKYVKEYKYNSKNIARFLQEKKELNVIPFNMQLVEAVEETKIVDMFLKLRNIKDKTDENHIFMECVLDLTNRILEKLQDMQMRMR